MPVVVVGQSGWHRFDTKSDSYTWPAAFNHIGGANQALIAVITARRHEANSNPNWTNVTWNNVALTAISQPDHAAPNNNNDALCYIGILRGAATGTRSLVIETQGGLAYDVLGAAVRLFSVTGVKQTGDPFGDVDKTHDDASTDNISVASTTTAAGSLMIAVAGGVRGSGTTTVDGWNADWTEAGSTQFGNFTGLSAVSGIAAAAYREIASSATAVTAKITFQHSIVRKAISQAEILAEAGYSLDVAQGGFSLSGDPVDLLIGRTLSMAAGAFTLNGQAVELRKGAGALVADTGSFTLAGQAANLVAVVGDYVLTAEPGTFALSGQQIGFGLPATEQGIGPSVWAGLPFAGFRSLPPGAAPYYYSALVTPSRALVWLVEIEATTVIEKPDASLGFGFGPFAAMPFVGPWRGLKIELTPTILRYASRPFTAG